MSDYIKKMNFLAYLVHVAVWFIFLDVARLLDTRLDELALGHILFIVWTAGTLLIVAQWRNDG